ncbi:kelch-like protein 10 [Parasteatoda tepidariorum]|uniref:kelch-like protein 10 n=1 Tax=Parasteatoda tepidariorum TaxID=114398 RepID=UPI0039BD51D5
MANNPKDLMDSIKDLLDSGEFFNLTILTEDGGSFKACLEIIVLYSSYFMQIPELNDNPPPWEILVPGVSKEIMATIIDFVNTNELKLRHNKIKEVMMAAELLNIPYITKLCKNFLVTKISTENCISVYKFANLYSYDDLEEIAKQFIFKNFEKIYTTNPQFLILPVNDLILFLSSDALNVKKEETVFGAILKWIEVDVQKRLLDLPSLLRFGLRVGLCDRHRFFNEQIMSNNLMLDNEDSQHFIFQVSQMFEELQGENGDGIRLDRFNIHHPFLRPRVPNELIFVMGGWSAGSATTIMETFDVRTERWFLSMHSDSVPRAYHGMLWHQKRIYVIGGFDGNQCFNSVRRFDPVLHVWEECGNMHVQRCYVSVAAIGDYIYAMGGYDGHRRSKTCERFYPDTNQWSMIAQMHNIRSDASADSLDGKIYIVGGFNGIQVLQSAECYDSETNEWTEIRNLNSPRSGVKITVFQRYLYAMGGFNGNQRLDTVERYDKVSNTWTYVAPMLGPRSNFAVTVLEGLIYVIGGFNGLATITTVETYDPRTNSWKHTTDLNLNRSALSACKVSDISTASEYCYVGAHSLRT